MNCCTDESKDKDNCCIDEQALKHHMMVMSKALGMLCDCFLSRSKDDDPDPLWKRFYRIQMSMYLMAKKNLDVSAPEGDMVHDLIRDSWLDVKDYMENSKFGPVSNVDQWFKTIRIDFPVDVFDPSCTFFRHNVYLMCQKDPKKKNLG